jgi:hypothetical protein
MHLQIEYRTHIRAQRTWFVGVLMQRHTVCGVVSRGLGPLRHLCILQGVHPHDHTEAASATQLTCIGSGKVLRRFCAAIET